MLKYNNDALLYFLDQFHSGKLCYDNGMLWRLWEPRRNWLPNPKPAEKLLNNGYYAVVTSEGGIYKSVMSHRLIWFYFNPDSDIYAPLVVNHIDGNKQNNNINNLELVTVAANNRHAIATGLTNFAKGLDSGRGKLSDEDVAVIRDLLASGEYKQKEIAAMYGVRPNHISRISTGARR